MSSSRRVNKPVQINAFNGMKVRNEMFGNMMAGFIPVPNPGERDTYVN